MLNQEIKKISTFNQKIKYIFTDIDDTLTNNGKLHAVAYQALWSLHEKGLHVIPVTGRPAGWCDMIARFWPVSGVVGENGGFYFRYFNNKMKRVYFFDHDTQQRNRKLLNSLELEILQKAPRSQVASDQFSRLMDLAIDFNEDVIPPLEEKSIKEIVKLFTDSGAQAKVSSIHVNGWFGSYDKLTMVKQFMKNEFSLEPQDWLDQSIFVGDSPNDEPLFAYFNNSVGVANVKNFLNQIKNPPTYVTEEEGGYGFLEVAEQILKNN